MTPPSNRASGRRSGLESLQLELFEHRFEALAREMGDMLQRMALSTNVKERLDFSCALLDAEGRLVVNAPHIPVHLGALGLCVRSVREVLRLEDGDVVVTNHPGFGGSHLPDVTVVTPVFRDSRLLGHVANRAHHAEIGGSRPGSVPPDATSLVEEGVVIEPSYVLRRGEDRWSELERLLRAGPYPSRSPEENLADLRAAVAANVRGAEKLRGLASEHGGDAVARYMDGLRERAAASMREALSQLGEQRLAAREELDDGAPIAVTITISRGEATVDFTGTGDVHPGNFNATPAIVTAATLYVLRLLLGRPLPLNEGLLEPIRLVIPPGLLAPEFAPDPARCPAVVGGNVETSQRVVDTLLLAFGLAACSQGTMNNLIFGNRRFGYYETICGGAGATPQADGASAVHTHMTNTRITDAEILEHRYPVRLHRFEIRSGSGGAGERRGGDGCVREIEALEELELSLLSQHRRVAPYGLEGGEAGAPGRQWIRRSDGDVEALAGVDSATLRRGDRIVVETPGGGGYGAPPGAGGLEPPGGVEPGD